jgi:hypothetical protein
MDKTRVWVQADDARMRADRIPGLRICDAGL